MGSLLAKLSRGIGTAVADYGMIEEGDVVAVAVSGGKDSLTLLDVLLGMRRRSPVKFDIVAVTVDQGYEGFRWPVMEKHFQSLGVPYYIEKTRISDLIEDHKTPGSTWCSLCARLRRGVLYGLAKEKGWSKIALGHHADDLIETHLLSQLFNGVLQSMPPILKAKDGVNVVIRPMCYVWERQVIAYTKERGLPVICCACPACRDVTLKRQRVKALLAEMEESWPGVKQSLLRSQRAIKLTQLMDPRFLPLGRRAAMAAEAGASPYWGIAQRGGDVPKEPGEGFAPAVAGENGGSEARAPLPLLAIRSAPSLAAGGFSGAPAGVHAPGPGDSSDSVISEPSEGTTIGDSREAMELTSVPAPPSASVVPYGATGGTADNTRRVNAVGSSCGAMCGCEPLA